MALPSSDRAYLERQAIQFREAVHGSHNGVIFPGWAFPPGKFDSGSGDLLILLPRGYPDCPPDMFYLNPWLRLTTNAQYPYKADVAFDFGGVKWQRWSRHNNEWRQGVDGIWTMLKRVEHALQETR